MKVKITSLMLMVIVGISLMACGDANAKSDSGIFEPIDSTTPEVAEYGPIDGVPAGAEFVAEPEVSTETETTEFATETDIAEVDPVDVEGEEYTGSLYTLPVAKKGEEWSEAQLDEYLASSKAFKKAYDGETFDLDVFMKTLGFECIGIVEGKNVTFGRYYYERGKFKIMCCPLYDEAKFYIFVDNGVEAVFIREHPIDYDSSIIVSCVGMPKDRIKKGISTALVKGVAASLEYLVHSNSKDCARLPFPAEYGFEYGSDGSVIYKDFNPIENPIATANREYPYKH